LYDFVDIPTFDMEERKKRFFVFFFSHFSFFFLLGFCVVFFI